LLPVVDLSTLSLALAPTQARKAQKLARTMAF